jgi:Cgl0159-like
MSDTGLSDEQYRSLTDVRVREPEAIAKALAGRRRRAELPRDGMLFIVAADHTARGMLGVGGDPRAMADRRLLLERLLTALANPRVDGVLASADILEDLVLLGGLDDRVAVGTMNRGGLAGATWELDDRFTAYDTDHLVAANLDAGKLLLRVDWSDPGTVPTLESSARAVQALNDHRMMAMVEPIPYTKDASGRAVWDDDPDRLLAVVGVCAALGGSSAYTWLKIQATADIAAVAAMTTQPLLLLGGAPGPDPEATFAAWERALAEPTVRGLVVGRALLYPPDDDVAAAVGRAAELVQDAAASRRGR